MSTHSVFAPPSPRHIPPHGGGASHPHHQASTRGAPSRKGGVWKVAAGVAMAGIAAMAAFFALSGGSGGGASDFMARMDAAAQGNPVAGHPGGAVIRVERNDDSLIVTATDVSPRDCVSAGWQLVRKGVLTINGTTPQRVSAAVLAELCNQQDSAVLRWAPRK